MLTNKITSHTAPGGRPPEAGSEEPPVSDSGPQPTAAAALERLLAPNNGVLPQCSKHEPYRPPQWRWSLAVLAARDPRVLRVCAKEIDTSVRRALGIVRELNHGAGLEALRPRYPAEVAAIGLRIAPEPRLRWELEARLMARQSPAEIALGCGVPADAIQLYEDWFYDVCDRLPRYVTDHLLPLGEVIESVPMEFVWKLVAFMGGSRLLDDLLRGADGRIDAMTADPAAWLRADTEEWATIRRWIFLRVTPQLVMTPKIGRNLDRYFAARVAEEQRHPEEVDVFRANVGFEIPGIDEGLTGCAPGARVEV